MAPRGAPALEVLGLCKRYGERTVLNGVSFDVSAGEIFGFVGPNGAGKTTTMRIVLGVLTADAGDVRWQGHPITFADRRRIGYMPEERGLYPSVGVLDQLVYFASLHGVPARSARAESQRWLRRLGVEARDTEQLQRLSHGNQQRVELVAALVHDPALLVLDEPFAGLDPVAVDAMSGVLRDLAGEGMPVLFSSHQLDLVEDLCDRVGIIHDGSVLACGSVSDLQRGGPEQFWIDVGGAPAGWVDHVSGAALVRHDGSRALISIAPGTDPQEVLRAALAAGPVLEFRRHVPRLTEVFRDVVSGATAP